MCGCDKPSCGDIRGRVCTSEACEGWQSELVWCEMRPRFLYKLTALAHTSWRFECTGSGWRVEGEMIAETGSRGRSNHASVTSHRLVGSNRWWTDTADAREVRDRLPARDPLAMRGRYTDMEMAAVTQPGSSSPHSTGDTPLHTPHTPHTPHTHHTNTHTSTAATDC